MKLKLYRQGDVLMKQVHSKISEPNFIIMKDFVIAYGEVTGHKHQVIVNDNISSIAIAELNGQVFLQIKGEGAQVIHEEHHSISLAPGDYKVVIQREWDLLGYARRVQD